MRISLRSRDSSHKGKASDARTMFPGLPERCGYAFQLQCVEIERFSALVLFGTTYVLKLLNKDLQHGIS